MENFKPSTTLLLEDMLTNTTINLKQQNTYSFNHQQSNDARRFLLHFNGVTGMDETANNDIRLWIFDGKLYISSPEFAGQQATVEVFNTLGQQVQGSGFKVQDGITNIQLQSKGMVIVRLTVGNKVLTCKGIVN
jgi:hypothetical protein